MPLRPGKWNLTRSSIRITRAVSSLDITNESEFKFREPPVASIGVEGRVKGLSLIGQVDWTGYDNVLKVLRENSPLDGSRFKFADRDEPDWSLAAEFRIKDAVRVRGGRRQQRPHEFRSEFEAMADEAVWTGGIALHARLPVVDKLVRIDADWWKAFGNFTVGMAFEF